MIYCILCCMVMILFLSMRIFLMRKSIKEIQNQLIEKRKHDTNTLISISSHDTSICELAQCLNQELILLRNQRLRFQQGDLELKESMTNISHDLRTPLTAIYGYLNLLEKEETSTEVRHYINMVEDRVNVLKQLTEELFRYSVYVTKPKETFDVVDLKRVIEDCLSAHYAALKGCHITPEVHICKQPVCAYVDRFAVHRILNNILSNMIKYSTGDAVITLLETGEIICSNHTCDLDDTTVGKLFDRFYTVESGVKSTGLGLSIAKRLSEQMGGEIFARYHDQRLSIHLQLPLYHEDKS